VRFSGQGLLLSKRLLTAQGNTSDKSCSLELLLRPQSINGAYTILSFYVPNKPKQFLVRQWTDGLVVTHDAANGPNRAEFDMDHIFQPGKLLLLTITSGRNGTDVYLNGSWAHTFSTFRVSPNELSGEIVIGGSPVEYEPWIGELHGLAVYSKELTAADVARHYASWISGIENASSDFGGAIARYTFSESAGNEIRNEVAPGPSLVIPENFGVPHKAMLISPAKEFATTREYGLHVLLNIAGFVPLGFILCAYLSLMFRRRNAILCTTFTAGTLSLVVEVLQAYIPQRVSDTTDVIANTVGATLGALFVSPGILHEILRVRPTSHQFDRRFGNLF
jgi:VanZ like family/Concanavalin A-like lectin/glucanases superfamily